MHLNEWTRQAESRPDLFFCTQTLCNSTFGIPIPMITIAQRPPPPSPAAAAAASRPASAAVAAGATREQCPRPQLSVDATRPEAEGVLPDVMTWLCDTHVLLIQQLIRSTST